MKIIENNARPFEEGMKAYMDGNKLDMCEYRPYSSGEDEWIRGWNYAKSTYEYVSESVSTLDEVFEDADDFFLHYHWIPLTEKTGYHDGRSVELDKPRYSGTDEDKRFVVYVNSGQKTSDGKIKAKKVTFGSKKGPDLQVNKDDEEARKSFVARHNCKSVNDKTTARYWSCRAPLSKSEGKFW